MFRACNMGAVGFCAPLVGSGPTGWGGFVNAQYLPRQNRGVYLRLVAKMNNNRCPAYV
jgi:hypothetical protein